MKRPELKNYFPESTTPEDIQKIFRSHPELYQYITALDAYVDWLEGKEQEKEELPCNLIRDGMTYDCTNCGKSFSDFDTSGGCPYSKIK